VDGKEFLTRAPCKLQPELQELIDAAGVLVGVNIHEDLRDFNFHIDIVTGSRLRFLHPIDVSVVARLAGSTFPAMAWPTLSG
jgi:hypothetical protein